MGRDLYGQVGTMFCQCWPIFTEWRLSDLRIKKATAFKICEGGAPPICTRSCEYLSKKTTTIYDAVGRESKHTRTQHDGIFLSCATFSFSDGLKYCDHHGIRRCRQTATSCARSTNGPNAAATAGMRVAPSRAPPETKESMVTMAETQNRCRFTPEDKPHGFTIRNCCLSRNPKMAYMWLTRSQYLAGLVRAVSNWQSTAIEFVETVLPLRRASTHASWFLVSWRSPLNATIHHQSAYAPLVPVRWALKRGAEVGCTMYHREKTKNLTNRNYPLSTPPI